MSIKHRFMRLVLLAGLASVGVGCQHDAPLAKLPPVEVVISQPVNEKVEDWDIYTGTVEARDNVSIQPLVRGEIKDVRFKDGDEVAANTLLFVIDDDAYQADLQQAKGQLTSWQAKLKAAEEKIAIYKPLADKGTIAKEELIQAIGAKGEATGGIELARGKMKEADVNITRCKIVAPIAGKLGLAQLTKGNLANPTSPQNVLTTIVAVDPIYVSFYVNQRALENYMDLRRRQYNRDKKAAPEDVPVEMALVTSSGYPFKGNVDFADNQVDKNTGNIKIRARFKNPKGPDGFRYLVPGMSARVRVSLADPYPAILITDRAILSDQTRKYVLAVNKAKNNTVERIDIVPAGRVQENGLIAVEAGLKGDEWLIVEGVNRARAGLPVNPKEAPMPRRPISK